MALVVLGIGLELCLLWWNRISLDDSVSHPASRRVAEAIFALPERVFGPIGVDTPDTGERVKIANFLQGFAPAFVFWALASWIVWRRASRPAGATPDDRAVLRVIVAFAAVFRLSLVPFPAILETDIHRYLWDGAVSASHINPYKYAPSEIEKLAQPGRRELYTPEELIELDQLAALRSDPSIHEHFKRINHAKIPTIYPPLAQVVFSAAHRIRPGSEGTLKLLVALVDLAIVGLVVALLGRLGRCQELVILYAWSPLVLKEYSNTGHYDPLAVMPVLAAIYLLICRRPIWASVSLGFGTLAKMFPAVLVLLLVRRLGILGVAAFAATVLVGYAPHLSIGRHVFDGLVAFAVDWQFNGGPFATVEEIFLRLAGKGVQVRVLATAVDTPNVVFRIDGFDVDPFLATKIVMAVAGLVLLWQLSRGDLDDGEGIARRVFVMVTAIVLLGPVPNTWYFCWILPFVCLFPSGSLIYLSGALVCHYLYFCEWRFPPWRPSLDSGHGFGWLLTLLFPVGPVQCAEYGPFYVLLAIETRSHLAAAARSARDAGVAVWRRVRDELRPDGA